MEQIMVASGELISSYDSSEMVRQARILAQSTAELIQAIKGEAETQSDSDLQVMKVIFILKVFLK
jgi:talin